MILDKLSEIAVLGTSKKSLSKDLVEWGHKFKLLADNQEQYLLQSGYLDLQMHEAGRLLSKNEELCKIKKVEDLHKAVNDNFIYTINIILNEHQELLLPYIDKLIAANRTLPASLIPKFLNYARQKDDIFKEKIKLISGNRAEFLANFNKNWSFWAETEIDWQTCSHSERILFLQKLRIEEPEKAVGLLDMIFSQEHSKEKLELLEPLAENLGHYDIAFLENCLNDRAQSVVQKAFYFLLILSSSAKEKLSKEAENFISIRKGGILSSTKMDLKLPEEETAISKNIANMNSHGIKLGKKAVILHKLLSCLIAEHYSCEIENLLKVADKTDWKDMLLSAWQNAAIMYNNASWAEKLIPELIKKNVDIEKELTELLSYEQFNDILKKMFLEYPQKFKSKEALGILLKNSNHEINNENSKIGIEQISNMMEVFSRGNSYLYHEDKKVINDFFARIPWHKYELPDNLEKYKEIIDIKQRLINSIQ